MTAADLADRLLDAQTDWVLGQLTDAQLPRTVARFVDDALAVAGDLVLARDVDPAAVKAVARHIADRGIASPLVADLVEQFAEAFAGLEGSDELGAVVAREHVDALVTKLLSMQTMRDRFLDRIAESPAVAEVATRFVSRIVADVIAQNRALAQRLPGMSSLLSLGAGAASAMRNPLDQLLGDAAGRSAQFAMRRTNSAARDLVSDSPLREAVLEVWDLHAGEPVARLQEYFADGELRELAVLAHAIVTDARTSGFTGEVIDACVDVVFARYGEWDLASLLAEAGIDRDDVVSHLVDLARPAVSAAVRDGALRDLIRARLAPFYESAATRALLAARPRPA
jgi:hypothetical protein